MEHTVQFRTVPAAAGSRCLEQPPATGGPERFRLQGVVLFVPIRYASVAKQRAAAGRPSVFHKRLFANEFGGHDDSSRICFQHPFAELWASVRYSVSRFPINLTAGSRRLRFLGYRALRNDLDHAVVLEPGPGCHVLDGKDQPLTGDECLARQINHLQV